MVDPTLDSDAVLQRFNRLIQELLDGDFRRNTFRPWEVELLLDIESCDLGGQNRREMLRRYQRAVRRHMERGGAAPFKLSEYLSRLRARRLARRAPGAGSEEISRAI